MKKTENIDKVVDALIRRRNFEPKMLEQKVFELWRLRVGNVLANHTYPVSLSEGILTVYTEYPAYKTELSFQKTKIIADLNAQLNKPILTDLRLELRQSSFSSRDRRRQSAPTEIEVRKNASSNSNKVVLKSDTLDRIEQVLIDITDETLRTALRQLFISQSQAEVTQKQRSELPIEIIPENNRGDSGKNMSHRRSAL